MRKPQVRRPPVTLICPGCSLSFTKRACEVPLLGVSMTEALPASERVEILTKRLAALNRAIEMDFTARLQEIGAARLALFKAQQDLANGG